MEETTDADGFPVKIDKDRKTIFADKKSIRSNEFYLASQSGYKLDLMFDVLALEYQSQKYLDYESKRYEIVRTYEKGDKIELVCRAYVDTP